MAKKTAPLSTLKVCTITVHRIPDEMATPDWLEERIEGGAASYVKEGASPEEAEKYIRDDQKRLREYEQGYWHFVGIVARAQIVADGEIRELRSMGLWGVESDSNESYFKEVEEEEIGDLKGKIKKAGARCQSFKVVHEEGR